MKINSKRGYQSHGQQSKKITLRIPKELLETFDKKVSELGNNRSATILYLMKEFVNG